MTASFILPARIFEAGSGMNTLVSYTDVQHRH